MRPPGWLLDADLLGYFTDASQDNPVFDPGLGAPCHLCNEPLSRRPRRTHSLALILGKRSWFFRTHRDCAERHPAELQELENAIIDELVAMENPQ